MMLERMSRGAQDATFGRPGFYMQVATLLWRDAVVAARDPTLYYLQVSNQLKTHTTLPRGGGRDGRGGEGGVAIEYGNVSY